MVFREGLDGTERECKQKCCSWSFVASLNLVPGLYSVCPGPMECEDDEAMAREDRGE